jgi:hypothetical protein
MSPRAQCTAGVPWNPPFNNQAGFTCERLFANGGCNPSNPRRFNASIAADMCCGNEHNTTCGAYYFSPVTSGSGGSRSIVSPGNPIVYQLTAAEAFLTYVEFTAIDVGTAGAKLAGGYDDDVIPMVENVHSWTTNGPFQVRVLSCYSVLFAKSSCPMGVWYVCAGQLSQACLDWSPEKKQFIMAPSCMRHERFDCSHQPIAGVCGSAQPSAVAAAAVSRQTQTVCVINVLVS